MHNNNLFDQVLNELKELITQAESEGKEIQLMDAVDAIAEKASIAESEVQDVLWLLHDATYIEIGASGFNIKILPEPVGKPSASEGIFIGAGDLEFFP